MIFFAGELSSLQDRINDVSCPAFHLSKGRSLAAISEGRSEASLVAGTDDVPNGDLINCDADSTSNDNCQWFLPAEYDDAEDDKRSSDGSVFESSPEYVDSVDGFSFDTTPVYTTSMTCVPSKDIVVHSGEIVTDNSDRDSVNSDASPSPDGLDLGHPLIGLNYTPIAYQNNHESEPERLCDSKCTQTPGDSQEESSSSPAVRRKWNRRPSGLEQYEVPYADMLKRSSKLWREIQQEHDETGKVDARKIIALKLFL